MDSRIVYEAPDGPGGMDEVTVEVDGDGDVRILLPTDWQSWTFTRAQWEQVVEAVRSEWNRMQTDAHPDHFHSEFDTFDRMLSRQTDAFLHEPGD